MDCRFPGLVSSAEVKNALTTKSIFLLSKIKVLATFEGDVILFKSIFLAFCDRSVKTGRKKMGTYLLMVWVP